MGEQGEEKKKGKRKGSSGLVFVGCLIIGWAVGLLTDTLPATLFIGLGVGFIAMAIMRLKLGEW